ncbi:MAG: hypothetical protein EOO48_03405 [Flavobacterium sp.]|nr:MAG: hypothetical protein EOO48_03405 [Flavobacterium sp.]
MKLENKTQKVISLPKFFRRVFRFGLFALGLIAVSLGVGVIGYEHFCQLKFIDSLYMSSMILTGMGPIPTVDITSTSGKLFSSAYALFSGVIFLGTSAVFFAPIIHRILHILQVEVNDNTD